MAKRWTEEEDQLLLKLRAEGYSAREMTLFVKERTHAAIRARIGTIATDNLNRKWTEEEKELVLKLKAEGKSNKYIARTVQRTARAVATFISRHWENIASHTSAETNL
jgi:DNA-binding NarL/FixJ family response regulator